jgi:hypothetical protein
MILNTTSLLYKARPTKKIQGKKENTNSEPRDATITNNVSVCQLISLNLK